MLTAPLAFAFVFVIGASLGSFVNVVADRLPAGQSLVRPGSHCPHCGTHLRLFDLVPVLSYVWLRGRCRYCGAAIPARLPLVEAGMGLLLVLALASYGPAAAFVVVSLAAALLMVIAVIDLEQGLILNKVLVPAAVVTLAVAPLWPVLGVERTFLGNTGALASLESSLAAGAGAFLFFLAIVLVRRGAMGDGDVKLAGVLGLLLGFPGILVAVWLAAVSGGLVAVVLLLLRKRGRKSEIPFGPFLAGGAVVALLAGTPLVSWYLGL